MTRFDSNMSLCPGFSADDLYLTFRIEWFYGPRNAVSAHSFSLLGLCQNKWRELVCEERHWTLRRPVTKWEARTRRNLIEHDNFIHALLIVLCKLLRYWTTMLTIIQKSKCTNIIVVDSEARISYGKPTDRRLLNAMNSYTKIVEHMDVASLRFATSMRSTIFA